MAAYDAAGNNSASSSKAVASTIAGVTPGLVAYYNFSESVGRVPARLLQQGQ
jgi:hypothetical protein